MKIGQNGSAGEAYAPILRAKRGRPKKKPDYDKNKEIDDLVQQAVTLFKVPFDDRVKRSQNAPSIRTVADQMDTTRIRVRKLLITAGYYSSELTRKIQSLSDQGLSIEQICEKTGLKFATVNALMPYKRGAYNLKDPPPNAESFRNYRKRNKACERLAQHLENSERNGNSYDDLCCDILWKTLDIFQNYSFRKGVEVDQTVNESQTEEEPQESETSQKHKKHQNFKYTIEYGSDCGSAPDSNSERLCLKGNCENRSYSRTEVEEAFYKIRKVQHEEGRVTKENCPCCEELYSIFLRIGACHC